MSDPDSARVKAVRIAHAWEELQRAEEQLGRAEGAFKAARSEARMGRASGLDATYRIRNLCDQLWFIYYRRWLDVEAEQ
jgi:hypothetical protein